MHSTEIARLASLVADNTRSCALTLLMDGRALPAGELARWTNVSPATMSGHLSKLVEGGLLRMEAHGKHRYYRLAGPKVATLLETFGTLVKIPSTAHWESSVPGEIRYARTCYRHLAGYVAVELNRAAQEKGYWKPFRSREREYRLTEPGREWLTSVGIPVEKLRANQGFARACLDWSERRHHLAGPLGALLLERLLEMRWVARIVDSRTVRITHAGEKELKRQLGLNLSVRRGAALGAS